MLFLCPGCPLGQRLWRPVSAKGKAYESLWKLVRVSSLSTRTFACRLKLSAKQCPVGLLTRFFFLSFAFCSAAFRTSGLCPAFLWRTLVDGHWRPVVSTAVSLITIRLIHDPTLDRITSMHREPPCSGHIIAGNAHWALLNELITRRILWCLIDAVYTAWSVVVCRLMWFFCHSVRHLSTKSVVQLPLSIGQYPELHRIPFVLKSSPHCRLVIRLFTRVRASANRLGRILYTSLVSYSKAVGWIFYRVIQKVLSKLNRNQIVADGLWLLINQPAKQFHKEKLIHRTIQRLAFKFGRYMESRRLVWIPD